MSKVVEEKILFIKNNKDLLINNFNLISYQLFLILNSDKALDEISAYQNLKSILENKEITKSIEKDDSYLIHTLMNILNKVVMGEEEKQECMNKLLLYSDYFSDIRKEDLKKSGKLIA